VGRGGAGGAERPLAEAVPAGVSLPAGCAAIRRAAVPGERGLYDPDGWGSPANWRILMDDFTGCRAEEVHLCRVDRELNCAACLALTWVLSPA
jgi:hypothetical protein